MNTSTTINSTGRGKLETRVLREGYGPGAWHGADLKAALADVAPELAFWRPAPKRHNVAEIALHHAYSVRAVRAQISGETPQPFVLDGEDWFVANDETTLPWLRILATVESEQAKLGETIAGIVSGEAPSSLSDEQRFDLVLGITCHAVYHAGQIQLIKRLREE
jgi:hypothetical protein